VIYPVHESCWNCAFFSDGSRQLWCDEKPINYVYVTRNQMYSRSGSISSRNRYSSSAVGGSISFTSSNINRSKPVLSMTSRTVTFGKTDFQSHAACVFPVKSHFCHRADDVDRASSRGESRLFACAWASQIPGRCHKIASGDKPALIMAHDGNRFPTQPSQRRCRRRFRGGAPSVGSNHQ